ncbi:MAG: ATP-binding protein [Planctomycetes bacterium]|nr:ATP-binding protein [Planctomycetota bacterium]
MAQFVSDRMEAHPFLVLPENRFAFTAIERLAGSAGGEGRLGGAREARLVFLCGPAGCGKSHLARYLLRRARSGHAPLSAKSVTAAEFAAELAEASVAGSVPKFQAQYRELDLLVCEDLGGIAGRRESLDQLATLVDTILRGGGRVLLTSRVPPRELADAPPRLVSRCRGGVLAAVQPPELDSRRKLLAQFASFGQTPLGGAAIERLAAAPATPRDLLAALGQLEARARIERVPLDEQLISRHLDGDGEPPAATLADVARAVARHFRVGLARLRNETRERELLVPRRCAMYLARELTGRPLEAIARYFGRRTHSTVVHACQEFLRSMVDDPSLRNDVADVRAALGACGAWRRKPR